MNKGLWPEANRKKVEVCYSPAELHLYTDKYDIVVAIDVLRATSAICAGIANGLDGIIPVSTVEEAKEYQDKGFLAAAERGGEIVEGFDFGNSPYSYMKDDIKGKTVVLTTTNGTTAINMASEICDTVVIGALNNLTALTEWLIAQEKNVLMLGSGWKRKFNLEDTICAGALADALVESGKFKSDEDSTIAARFLFKSAKNNIFGFLKASSHRKRLKRLNLNEDVKYCLTVDTEKVIPILRDGKIVNLEYQNATLI